ncbi:MAG TPA: carbon-nitrogen hydrolase family protein [Burkholderiaceae bacterium]|nr:carbon-nitrogen hydrolase family protein [Burkholderiaceae bacterium]
MSTPRNRPRLKVAACQLLNSDDIGSNVERICEFLESCAEQSVDLATFPEGTLYGYCCRTDFWEQMTPEIFRNAEEQVAHTCARLNIAAVVGTAFRSGDRWINGLVIFERDGRVVGRYGKTFLGGDTWCDNFSGQIPVIEIAGVKACFAICRDIRYPEIVRLPAILGAEILIYCTCESGLTAEHKLSAYRAMPISRAAENEIYVVMANAPANPDNIRSTECSHGNSKIIDPLGNVLVEAGHFEERAIIAEIDFALATRRVATRVLTEPTILQEWYRQGLQFVDAATDSEAPRAVVELSARKPR